MIKTITTTREMQQLSAELAGQGKTIGLVPTMGYFHKGHISLMERSVADNDVTITTLFVNPTQFGSGEDLGAYPADLEHDTKMAEGAGVNIIFHPSNEEMYPEGYKTYIKVEDWSKRLCGRSRPIHFRGVTTICNKLFNICRPNRAYFGLKDAQQVLIIKKMVADLNMNLEVVPLPTVREDDGLAMSSRNVYLTAEERVDAVLLSKALLSAKKQIEAGNKDADKIENHIRHILSESDHIHIDYVSIVSTETLVDLKEIEKGTLIALAVYLGKARLIDNIIIE